MQVFPNISVSFSCGTLNNLFSRVCVLLPFSVTSTTQVLSDILVTHIVPMAVAAYLSISVSSAVVHTALKLTFQSFHYSNLKVSGNGLCQHNVNKAAMLADNSHIMRVFCISAGPTCGAKSSHEDSWLNSFFVSVAASVLSQCSPIRHRPIEKTSIMVYKGHGCWVVVLFLFL